MTELEKRVAGDWYDIRTAARDHFDLKDLFKLPGNQLLTHIDKLRHAVEGGIVEYKRSSLSPLFRALESTKYQSLSQNDIEVQVVHTRSLLYLTLIQRLFFDGSLKFSVERKPEEKITTADLDLKSILKDINSRISDKPEFSNNPSVKWIHLQAGQYRKERETMQKLLPSVKPENREAFNQNFKKSFSEIFEKIKKSYLEILEEENPPSEENLNVLARIPVKELLPNITAQCQCISNIRSTLSFVREEKYKTRAILTRLAEEKNKIHGLFDREMRKYGEFASSSGSEENRERGEAAISRKLALEVIRVLEKDLAV